MMGTSPNDSNILIMRVGTWYISINYIFATILIFLFNINNENISYFDDTHTIDDIFIVYGPIWKLFYIFSNLVNGCGFGGRNF